MRYLFETEEHATLRAQVRRWAEREIAPHASEWEEAEEFPRALYGKAAEAGLIGLSYPESVGGGGGDLTHAVVAAEEMILGGRSVGVCVGLGSHAIALPPILHLGTDAQRVRWIPPVLRGEQVAALAITEPGGGSDVAALRTRARRDGAHWVIDGSKTFITSGARADLVTVAVRTGEQGHGGISLIVVDASAPGYRVGRRLKKMGWWASDTAELSFSDVRVPVANRLGEEGSGFFTLMRNFQSERLGLAAYGAATAQLALEESERYVREREAFGRALAGFQVTRHKLADMATRVLAARLITYQVAKRVDLGDYIVGEISMAKNVTAETAVSVTYDAVQLHGGMGYMRETLVERLSRDARLLPIGGGTQEIMREIIAKRMGF